MGVMSRRVLPVCGNLCCFCPSLRARSRQPVKRYKKMLAEIFPRNQDAEPNYKKIGKLCDYSSKNPLRIPKINEYLEQRCYKDLRNANFGYVKVVFCIYQKLLSSCKEHLLLFASSMLGIIRTVLEETRLDDLYILACTTLVDFMNSQADSTYMFNLEGLIPKLCQVASEAGNSDQALCLRSTGMQALACMVLFMGDHSHIFMDFHKIISVMLDNYTFLQRKEEMLCLQSDLLHTQSNLNVDDKSSLPGMSKQATFLPVVLAKADVEPPMDAAKNPSYWSRVCLRNIARLAKEAATAWRVLEPLFQSFDAKNYWPIDEGLGCSVLMYLQSLLDESESSSDMLLSILVKHLDHKNVSGKFHLQIDIVKVTTVLARNAKRRASVTVLGAISELIKQLRRCVQRLEEGSTAEGVIDKNKADLQSSLENCILDLSNMVGDVGPILDTMAIGLESLPVTAIVARSAIFAVYRIACMISSIPSVSYDKKAFSDALFHQLILAMAHPDCETRVGAHCILSTVLMPKPVELLPSNMDVQKYCFKFAFHNGRTEIYSLRLSSHQVSILLSSIWVQATSFENTPENYEAMAHTYNIAFLFARSKEDNHAALARCFQLALSLRSVSLEVEGCLQPSRKRSLFTLASYMIIVLAKAENLSELITHVKASLTAETIDPYFELIDDTRLGAVCSRTNISYGSKEDEAAAVKSLSAIVSDEQQLKEMILLHLISKSGSLTEDELSTLKEQFLQAFSPDEAYPLGIPSIVKTPRPCPPLGNVDLQNLDQVTPADSITDDDNEDDDSKSLPSPNPVDVLNVNQLMESVRETAQHVANIPVSSTPVSYDQMKSQCESLNSEKHNKLSMLQSFKNQEEDAKEESVSPGLKKEFSEEEDVKLVNNIEKGTLAINGQFAFRLPPSSPYDKFLKAAGC